MRRYAATRFWLERMEDRWCPSASLLGLVSGVASGVTAEVSRLATVSVQLPPLGISAEVGSTTGQTLLAIQTPVAEAQVGAGGVEAAVLPMTAAPVLQVTVPLAPTPSVEVSTPLVPTIPSTGGPSVPLPGVTPPGAVTGQPTAPVSAANVPTTAVPAATAAPVANAAPAGTAPAATEAADPGLSVPAPARTPTRTPEFAASETDDADAEDVDAPADDAPQADPAPQSEEAPAAAVGGLSANLQALQQGLEQLLAGLDATGRRVVAALPGLDTPWGYAAYLTALTAVAVGVYALTQRTEEEEAVDMLLVDHPSMPLG